MTDTTPTDAGLGDAEIARLQRHYATLFEPVGGSGKLETLYRFAFDGLAVVARRDDGDIADELAHDANPAGDVLNELSLTRTMHVDRLRAALSDRTEGSDT